MTTMWLMALAVKLSPLVSKGPALKPARPEVPHGPPPKKLVNKGRRTRPCYRVG